MSLVLRAGGSWREAESVSVRVSGSWREADEVFVRQGGQWRSVWTSFTHVLFVQNSRRDSAQDDTWTDSYGMHAAASIFPEYHYGSLSPSSIGGHFVEVLTYTKSNPTIGGYRDVTHLGLTGKFSGSSVRITRRSGGVATFTGPSYDDKWDTTLFNAIPGDVLGLENSRGQYVELIVEVFS